jgi:myo-inositol 2-dehydrogenase / D-chiro-inositol 1-dehydrogenase
MTGPKHASTRRHFLQASSAAAVGTAALGVIPSVHAAGKQLLRVGVIGCGGRGRGAAENICEAAGNTYDIKIHALGDAFEDNLKNAYDAIKGNEKVTSKFDVDPERCFHGFDNYKHVVDCCDLIILATPPGFRPQHLEYAIGAGKHVFTEKPVAVDGPGIRKVLAAADEAKKKNIAVVAGTQRRHQAGYLEAMKKVHGGDIGDVLFARVFWNQGNIWARERKPEWSDFEYQVRNWYHYNWLCGDCIVEQHVHNLDVALWALKAHPESCVAMGGQQVNRAPEFGNSFDHFAVDYAFPNNVRVLSMARQIEGCANAVSEHLVGKKGGADLQPGQYVFRGAGQGRLRVRDELNPYVQEHIDLLASISSGTPLNELKQVAESCLTAIMGRMSAYTGKEVTWDQALNSQEDTFPKKFEFGPYPFPKVAVPGQTPLV